MAFLEAVVSPPRSLSSPSVYFSRVSLILSTSPPMDGVLPPFFFFPATNPYPLIRGGGPLLPFPHLGQDSLFATGPSFAGFLAFIWRRRCPGPDFCVFAPPP